jgi:RNA polymerase sigma factor (sigma-70 family)
VSNLLQTIEGPGDAELISAVRGGDIDAYGQLFERHVDAARRLARQLVSSGDVDDLVSDAFAKVLVVLQRGGGPDVAFRAYLLTAVRRLQVDRFRAGSRLQVTDDMEAFDPGVPFRDTAVEGFENVAAARAFSSLPERWQAVLWHTEVEGQRPADVAVLLGMTPNSVSALAYRAREGLRQAFLTQHAAEIGDDTCRWTHEHLGAYVRDGLSRRDTTKVEHHVQECRTCAAIYLELTEVNSNLSAVLGPLLLGGVAAAYVASGTSATGIGAGIAALVGRARDLVLSDAPAAAAAGVATTAVVTGAVFVAVQGGDGGTVSSTDVPVAPTVTSGPRGPGPSALALEPGRRGSGSDSSQRIGEGGLPVELVTGLPTALPAPTDLPTDLPTGGPDGPTDEPGEETGDDPTSDPTRDPTSDPTRDPTSDPTRDPTSDPTRDPSDDPTRQPPPTVRPTDDPTPTREPTPPLPPVVRTDDPAGEPSDPPAKPMAIDVTTQPRGDGLTLVLVTVAGAPTGADMTVRVSGIPGLVGLVSTDGRCEGVVNNLSCSVSAPPYAFLGLARDGTQITFTVTAAGRAPVSRTLPFDAGPTIG